MEKRKFLRLRLKIRLSCSDLHYIFHILNSIGGPLGPMVQTSPSAQSDRSRTIKKIIKPVWTSSPEFGGGPSGALRRTFSRRLYCYNGRYSGLPGEDSQDKQHLGGIIVIFYECGFSDFSGRVCARLLLAERWQRSCYTAVLPVLREST